MDVKLLFSAVCCVVALLGSPMAELSVASVKAMAKPTEVGSAPSIDALNVIWYGGTLYIWGTVSDPDGSPVGHVVQIGGTFSRTLIVDQNNTFGTTIITQTSAGTVTAVAIDPQGNQSSPEFAEYGR